MDTKLDLRIGGYHLIEPIGQGGTGIVYRAVVEDEGKTVAPGTVVALKLLYPHMRSMHGFIRQFDAKGRLLASLNSPHLVRVFEVGVQEGSHHYLAMEYMRSLTLSALLEPRKPLPPQLVLTVMIQACQGLIALATLPNLTPYSHVHCMVHQDVVPDKIFIAARQPQDAAPASATDFDPSHFHVKLGGYDFGHGVPGFAKLLFQAGRSLGDPAYMAHELFGGDEATPCSDLYSLGVIAYQLLTGSPPFYGPTPVNYEQQHEEVTPPSPRSLNPSCPKRLSDCIRRCLEKSAMDRYQRAEQLLEDLTGVKLHAVGCPPHMTSLPRHRSFARWLGF